MKKTAAQIKVGDIIHIGTEKLKVATVETSDISKQGTKKVRIEAQRTSGEKVAVIRPADYPFDVEK
jgi:translation elongation factor P/translation initiation factor 5A